LFLPCKEPEVSGQQPCGARWRLPFFLALSAWPALLLSLLLCGIVRAQTPVDAGTDLRQSISPPQRQELYRQLASQAEVLQAQSSVVKTVAKLVGPAVVHIEVSVTEKAVMKHGGNRLLEEAGSGVIVKLQENRYVITNRHLIDGAVPAKIRIKLADGRIIAPSKVWQDSETDVAVMAVDAPGLGDAAVGDSQQMDVGDFVLAVGSPFGLSHSVTYGIISAKGRRDLDMGGSDIRLQDFLQTDAAINPGNSGGPLINLRGEVIGINCAIASPSGGNYGIGFAIPSNMVMNVARQLVEQGKVTRAFLGVNLDAVSPIKASELGLERPAGALITLVTPNSPAEAAGLQRDDVILRIGDTPIDDDGHVMNVISFSEVGKEIPVVVYRDRKSVLVNVSPSAWPPSNVNNLSR
jgi:serine protease Do